MSAELIHYMHQHPGYNPPIRRDRRKLDIRFYQQMSYWRRRIRPVKLKCKAFVLARTRNKWYQFRYRTFPKDILFELGKSSMLGFRLTRSQRFDRCIFLRELHVRKMDPTSFRVQSEVVITEAEWKRLAADMCMEKINFVIE